MRTKEPRKRAGRIATSVFLGAVFIALPLAVHDGYFDITETKHIVFLAAGASYALLELLLWLIGRAACPFQPHRGLLAADIGLYLFVAAYCLGAFMSDDPGAFVGLGARYQGVMTILVYALVYLCLSRNFCWTELNWAAFSLGLGLACLLAVLNDFGLDPLGMAGALASSQRWQFVSTLGNTNFYSAFLGALLPVALCFWCYAEKGVRQAVSGLTLLLGFMGMLPTASESFMLALLAGLWLLPPFLMRRPRALKRYLAALMAMALILAALRLLTRFVPTVQYLSASMRLLSHPLTLLAMFSVCGALLFMLHKKSAPICAQRTYCWISLTLAVLAVAGVTLANTAFRETSFGSLDRFIKLNAAWGTDRGRIWAYCLSAFREFSAFKKLFGGGPACLLAYDAQHPLFPDAYLDSAHNEYLQYLLSSGIVGLSGYLLLIAGTAAAALKRAEASPLALAGMAGVIAYAAQAVVNIAQPVSTPYLFLLLGMAAGCAVESMEKNELRPEAVLC